MNEKGFLTTDDEGGVIHVAVDILYCETVGTPAWDRVLDYCLRNEVRRSEIEDLRAALEPLSARYGQNLLIRGDEAGLLMMEHDYRRVARRLLEQGALTPWSEWDRLQTGICS